MGKKTVQLDEAIHDEIEEIQTEFMRLTGEDPPSKEEVIETSVEKKKDQDLLEELFTSKKKDEVSRFDEVFSL